MVDYGTKIHYLDKNYEQLKKEAYEFLDTHEDATVRDDNEYIRIEQLSKNEMIERARNQRRFLLEETDIECLSDRQPSEAMIEYRQALRDITEQPTFPYNIVWPQKPKY